jgi:hypothetical protein
MKRTEAARAGAEKLMRAEAAIDAALRETAELMGLLPTLRLETKLSAVLGQEAVANLGETLTHIVSARRTIIETHSALAAVRSPDRLRRHGRRRPGQGSGSAAHRRFPRRTRRPGRLIRYFTSSVHDASRTRAMKDDVQ